MFSATGAGTEDSDADTDSVDYNGDDDQGVIWL